MAVDCCKIPHSVFTHAIAYITDVQALVKDWPVGRGDIREDQVRRVVTVKDKMGKTPRIVPAVTAVIPVIVFGDRIDVPIVAPQSFEQQELTIRGGIRMNSINVHASDIRCAVIVQAK